MNEKLSYPLFFRSLTIIIYLSRENGILTVFLTILATFFGMIYSLLLKLQYLKYFQDNFKASFVDFNFSVTSYRSSLMPQVLNNNLKFTQQFDLGSSSYLHALLIWLNFARSLGCINGNNTIWHKPRLFVTMNSKQCTGLLSTI